MSDNTSRDYHLIQEIQKYGRRQLLSWETPEAVVMTLAAGYIVFGIFPAITGSPVMAIIVFLIVFPLAVFAVYETFKGLRDLTSPWLSPVFRNCRDMAAKEALCAEIDLEMQARPRFDNDDLTALEHFFLLHGERDFDVVRCDEVRGVYTMEYRNRKGTRQQYFIYFTDQKGKKHELDLHFGKDIDSAGSAREIREFLKRAHPEYTYGASKRYGSLREEYETMQERMQASTEEEKRDRLRTAEDEASRTVEDKAAGNLQQQKATGGIPTWMLERRDSTRQEQPSASEENAGQETKENK